jgi:hypothetical protein
MGEYYDMFFCVCFCFLVRNYSKTRRKNHSRVFVFLAALHISILATSLLPATTSSASLISLTLSMVLVN